MITAVHQWYFVYKEGSLAGAKFKVYAAEDIYTADNQKDADGNRIKYYSKGDLVTTLTTGKDGKATAKNLPLGQYRVVEVEAPYGYVLNPNEQKVTFTYVDDKTPVIKESLTFSDDRQKLDMSVTKLDAEDNTPIAGAVFGLYADEDIKNADGRVIIEKGTLLEKATSDENGKIAFVKNYPFAKYVARELVKPAGYVTNERQKVQITVTKTDSETKEALEGAVFGLFAKEDIVNKDGKVIVKADTQIERTVTGKDGKVLDTLTTDKNGHAESKELPICTYNEDGSFKEDIHYTVVETKAADGYILDETAHDVTLRYDDNAPDVVVTTLKLINVPTEPKLPQTGDNANPLLYLGIGALALITGVGVGLRGRKKKNKQ